MGATAKNNRVLKRVRNIALSSAILLVLIVGAGVAYTWFMGQSEPGPTAASAPPVAARPTATIKPAAPAANAKESAAVESITSPVAPGENASMEVKTLAGSTCTIAVVYDKMASTDSGLGPKVADEFGIVNWTWTVESTAPVGTWPMKVTCTRNKQSAVVQGDLTVSLQKE